MKLGDLLKEQDLQELGPMTTTVAPGGAMMGTTQPGGAADPKIQTALVAKQQQDKIKQRKAIQDQIAMLTKQIADLRKQMADLQ